MKRLLTIACAMLFATALMAQPAKSRTQLTKKTPAKKEQTQQKQGSVRKFPVAPTPSEDVAWRRDVYRTLDLTKDANAPLYYPVEPMGKQMNLFTYVFRLLLSGRISAYNFTLDGNEHFEASNKVVLKDLMESYGIYYEQKDGAVTVAPQDIPSAEVTRYYIKESSYFDQRTSTYSQRVVAICPVLMRNDDDLGGEATPYPLFWLNYSEIAEYLSMLPVMASNYNNITNMTANDFFTTNRYDGAIYKTNNMQGRTLQDYCKDDSAMTREQKRIEQQLKDFEGHIWTTQQPDTTALDSTAAKPADKRATARRTTKATDSKATEKKTEKTATRRSKAASSASSGNKVSARRQRR